MKPSIFDESSAVIEFDYREFIRIGSHSKYRLLVEQIQSLGYSVTVREPRELTFPIRLVDEYTNRGFFVTRCGKEANIHVRQYIITVEAIRPTTDALQLQVERILQETGHVFTSIMIGQRVNFDRLAV